jgi:hypothetical protein
MATSGVTDFNLDLRELVEEAGERCGYEIRTGYDFTTARRSMNLLLLEWANRGLNMWTFDQQEIALLEDVDTYNLPIDTVDVMDAVIRTSTGASQVDIAMSRIALPVYHSIPNKLAKGRPLQMLVLRSQTPQIVIWPRPNVTGTYTFVYWRLRRLESAGSGVHTQDVPFRFMPALVAGLAYYMALKLPGALPRVDLLKGQYEEAMQMAMDEDREKAPLRLVPGRSF